MAGSTARREGREGVTPRILLRVASIVEACTWGALIAGMLVKYATPFEAVGDPLVSVAGSLHGVAFCAYVYVVVMIAANERWGAWAVVGALSASIVPFATLAVAVVAERRGAAAGPWRRVTVEFDTAPSQAARRDAAWRRLDGFVRWSLEHPLTLGCAAATLVVFALARSLAS